MFGHASQRRASKQVLLVTQRTSPTRSLCSFFFSLASVRAGACRCEDCSRICSVGPPFMKTRSLRGVSGVDSRVAREAVALSPLSPLVGLAVAYCSPTHSLPPSASSLLSLSSLFVLPPLCASVSVALPRSPLHLALAPRGAVGRHRRNGLYGHRQFGWRSAQ